jgi:alpha-mannosidase
MHGQGERIRKRVGQLADVLKGKIYSDKRPLDQLLVSSPTDRISYAEAQKLDYRPAKLGEQFGPIWTTFWFRGQVTVPPDWANKRVDLIWISHYCESTLWMAGKAVQGLNYSFGERSQAILAEHAKAQEKIDLEIEMACNTAYGVWPPEKPYKSSSPYVLDQCEVGVFDPIAWKLYFDFLVLQQLETEIATTGDSGAKAFGAELLYELNRFANTYSPLDVATWQSAHKILEDLYKHHNGTATHEISAVGEAHLDMAWMWPMAETWRKFIRTASNQIGLMDSYPEYRFVCTQACLYEDLKQRLPELFERVKAKVKNRQWIPVGGSWVEPDTNMPSGESLVRQFLFGQRYFQKEFGIPAQECWLQDSFGFTAQLPQLMKSAGMTRFVTQKLFYGTLKPEHRIYSWNGLDGTNVLAHFPPIDCFSKELTVSSVSRAAREYVDDQLSARFLLSFGWGDGGGGPSRSMLEITNRLKELQGAPKVVMRSPSQFFELLEADLSKRAPATWTGELYFSRHRGTYTSQAHTKKAMRIAERMLHDLEFLSAAAYKSGAKTYPQEEINQLWKIVLLNQHHDIISGTSITTVHETAVMELESVIAKCELLSKDVLGSISGAGKSAKKPVHTLAAPAKENNDAGSSFVNTTSFDRYEVIESPDGTPVVIQAPSYGFAKIASTKNEVSAVSVRETGEVISFENENLVAEFNRGGDLLRLFHKGANREALVNHGNKLEIYDEQPVDYDAWEIEAFNQETFENCAPAHSCQIDVHPLRSQAVFERKIGRKSSMKQTVRLDALSHRLEFHCEVNWQEEHKLLKVLFPVAVQSSNATYETQFGAVERPTHYNTPYDQTRFEVVAHKWSDLSEHGFGVALLSDCKYGFSVLGNQMRLSLLRAPKSPDPTADIGAHTFAYAIMPHRGRWQEGNVVSEAFKFNYPLVRSEAAMSDKPSSFAQVNDANLIIDTIKKAEDSDALIVRLYECHGAHGTARLTFGFPVKSAKFTNILEIAGDDAAIVDGAVHIPYRPFQIITLALKS